MYVIFDARVLIHKTYTGVENYTKHLLKHLKGKIELNVVKPKTDSKYLAHLWNHFILPFKSGEIIFCPANMAPLFVARSKKLVVTIHDVAFLTHPDSFSVLFRYYYKYLMPFIIKRADRIITISNFSRDEIIQYYPLSEGKLSVIYLGVDRKFRVIDTIIKEKIILYVGSMNERKNFIGLIKAFELLNSDDYRLLIVGNFSTNFVIDDMMKGTLQDAKENTKIEFRHNVCEDELIDIYNQSSLLVFPSFYEGFGLPPLEAMACGTPVIISDMTSLPEVCGDAALYCNPHNYMDIKEKIELVLDDGILQKRMMEKGFNRVKQFTWDISTKNHMEVFEKVMKS